MSRRLLVSLLVVFALVVSACAADSEATTTTAAPAAETTAAPADDTTETTAAPAETTAAPALEGPYEYLAMARNGDYSGTEVEVLAQWVDAEADNFEASIQPFVDATGINVNFEGITDYETVLTVRVDGGNAPDVAQIAQPGKMRAFAEEGKLVALSEWTNVDQLKTDYIQSFIDLGSHNGDIYGVFYKGDLKSIVWYPVQAFADAGYSVPTTWDELVALSDQIVADGNGSPWCVSIEHGDASGWVATDWMEDILLRTAPTDTYDKWITHEIPFNDAEVLEAAEYMKSIWFNPDYVYGGNIAINATWVGDTQTPMFDAAGPQCWMHKQAAWIPGFWPEGTEAGVDSSFFYFPEIEAEYGSPVLGGGDQFMMFNDRPEVRAFMEYLATAESAQAWIAAGGFVSPNQSVPLDWYTSYPNDELARILNGATTFRFDASDTMPAEVGNGTFWSGMVDWVASNGDDTEGVFEQIENSWPSN
ncbi:MAG: carbohydrate ABC transporter substrate-binding protein [bacterium]|nr:carbohydrate ABC transporter substrate-binding protein [bacterium]